MDWSEWVGVALVGGILIYILIQAVYDYWCHFEGTNIFACQVANLSDINISYYLSEIRKGQTYTAWVNLLVFLRSMDEKSMPDGYREAVLRSLDGEEETCAEYTKEIYEKADQIRSLNNHKSLDCLTTH